MPRPPAHASGKARSVTLRLSPHHLAKLDRLAESKNKTRSALVANIIDRVAE
jgi:predicted transcriptional regulator